MFHRIHRWVNELFNRNAPSKVQPFDEILFSRTGTHHQTGVFAKTDKYTWERGKISEITSVTYDSFRNSTFSVDVLVQTVDGLKEMKLMSSDLHYLAPYVPAESVDGLTRCVIPVMYERGESNCMLSAENGYLVAEREDFSVPPEEALA